MGERLNPVLVKRCKRPIQNAVNADALACASAVGAALPAASAASRKDSDSLRPARVSRRTLPGVPRVPYQGMPDAALVEAVARGDHNAIGAVWDRHSRTVRNVLRVTLERLDELRRFARFGRKLYHRSEKRLKKGEF